MRRLKYLICLSLIILLSFSAIPVHIGENTSVAANAIVKAGTKGFTGWKVVKGKTYYYKKGVKQKGFVKISKKTYYFNKKGILQKGWQKIFFKKYYFNSDGVMQTAFKTIKGKTYYFNKKGVMQTGFKTIKGKTYYFNGKGVMQTGWKPLKQKVYYFDSNGVMQTGIKTIGNCKYYFNSKGIRQTGLQKVKNNTYYFDGRGIMRTGWITYHDKTYYFNGSGAMQTGFQTIDGDTYYFKPDGSQIMATSGTVTVNINSAYCVFDTKGVYYPTKSYCIVNGVKVQLQYYSDPSVSTEQLLAAIIYSEAGNQKLYSVTGTYNGQNVTLYKGQLGVGYVIANRLTSGKSYKEVIYQLFQFEPARTGVLTKYLNNYNLVSEDCKNAARVILYDVSHNTNSVPEFPRSGFTWKNFWAKSYADKTDLYQVYGVSGYVQIQDQIFFNYTKTISLLSPGNVATN